MIYHKDNLLELYDSGDVLILFSATNDKKGEYDWEDIIKYGKSITLWFFIFQYIQINHSSSRISVESWRCLPILSGQIGA